MPLFEYRCTQCQKTFEELVSGDRDKKIPCPSCGSDHTEKLMSAIGSIAMGKSSGPACASSCPSGSMCAASGGGGCCGGMGH